MPPVGFETTISAGERPQNYALDGVATGTGCITTLHYSPKERRSHLHGGGSLKSRMQLRSKQKSKVVSLFKKFSVSYRILRSIATFITTPFCSNLHPHRESNICLQSILPVTHMQHSSKFPFTVFDQKFL